MKLPPLSRAWMLSAGICGTMLIGFFLGVYLPKSSEAGALADQLRMQQAVLARLTVEAARTKDVERDLAGVQQTMSTLERKLWTARETPRLLDQLDELAGQSGVTVTSIKPGILEVVAPPAASSKSPRPRTPQAGRPAGPDDAGTGASGPNGSHGGRTAQTLQPQPAYQKFTVDVETRGTFSATARFIQGLDSLPRFLSLSEMRVTVPQADVSDNPDDPVLVVDMTATAYALPETDVIP